MKTVFAFAVAAVFAVCSSANADVVASVDFESAGGYTTSIAEYTNGGPRYFTRTDGTNTSGVYGSPQGSSYFAAQDHDGAGNFDTFQTLTIGGVDIADCENLSVSFLLAEDDDGTRQDWDDADFFRVFVSIDSGVQFQVFGVEANGFNTEPRVDNDFDGFGDGVAITSTFAAFSAAIAGTGSTLELEFQFNFSSLDEDIAIDNIVVSGDHAAVPEPYSMAVIGLVSLGLVARRRR